MFKKIMFSFLTLAMILSSAVSLTPVKAATQVCGMDGNNYSSADAAEEAGVDVSYEFSCINPSSETSLYEDESDINFEGMLVEIGSTDIPTTIIVRPNNGGADYTVNVTNYTILGQKRGQETMLSDWIPGDQIRVIGKKNENTETIDATILVNLSIKININRAANGWITNINKNVKEITYQWNNAEYTFSYDDNTRFAVAGKNPASIDDLEVNDRIRTRLLFRVGDTPLAKIVVVLRRGPALFMKIRTFRPNATLVRLDSTIVPTTIQVKIENTPGLKANDINNLIGSEGTLVTVNVTEDTKIVRKYFGRTTLEEFSVGDKLHIVGRVNDDGTVDAKMIKNNSIWKTSTQGHAGVVTEINAGENYLMMNWTPIRYLTGKELKAKLQEKDNAMVAQTINKNTLVNRLKNRIKTAVSAKVGQFIRNIKNKKVKIERIQHNNVKVGDLVERLPVRKVKIEITEDTKIVVGTNDNATISDIQVGDKVRIRGIRHAKLPLVTAEIIVIVNSLPEVEEESGVSIDDVNEIVSEIVINDTANAITIETGTATEEEVGDGENSNE